MASVRLSQASDRQAAVVALAFLSTGDRSFPKEETTQMLVELRILAADPLERHRGVLFLFVAVVGEDAGEIRVVGGVDPLRVPVDGLELFDERRDCAMHLARLGSQRLARFVEGRVRHVYDRFPRSAPISSLLFICERPSISRSAARA